MKFSYYVYQVDAIRYVQFVEWIRRITSLGTHSFSRSFIHSFVHSVIHLVACIFIYICIYSLIDLFSFYYSLSRCFFFALGFPIPCITPCPHCHYHLFDKESISNFYKIQRYYSLKRACLSVCLSGWLSLVFSKQFYSYLNLFGKGFVDTETFSRRPSVEG